MLNCTATRSATLSWFKKENSSSLTKIVPTSRISITFWDVEVNGEGYSISYSVLNISSVTVSDGSTYVCEAQYDDNSTRTDHTAQVNGIVQIIIAMGLIMVWHVYYYIQLSTSVRLIQEYVKMVGSVETWRGAISASVLMAIGVQIAQ